MAAEKEMHSRIAGSLVGLHDVWVAVQDYPMVSGSEVMGEWEKMYSPPAWHQMPCQVDMGVCKMDTLCQLFIAQCV